MKSITVFFDLEGWLHNPSRGEFDIERIMQRILDTLDKYKVKAAFNTCGIVAEKFPELIETIYNKKHEIASHGYKHENFAQLEPDELDRVLAKTEELIHEVTGEKPIGVRSPWLIHNEQIYSVIEKRGYRWVSNQYISYPEIWYKPASFSVSGGYVTTSPHFFRRVLNNIRYKKSWRKGPHKINQLLEIPLMSSMDGCLLSYLPPTQNSPDRWLDYAYESLIKQFHRSENYFNLNFHPWVIGSANRLILLDKILNFVSDQGVEFVLPKELLKINQ